MYLIRPLFGVVAVLGGQAALAQVGGSSGLVAFAELQSNISLQGALNNIGPDGSSVPGAGNYVVAAPSKINPNCQYIPWKPIKPEELIKQTSTLGLETRH